MFSSGSSSCVHQNAEVCHYAVFDSSPDVLTPQLECNRDLDMASEFVLPACEVVDPPTQSGDKPPNSSPCGRPSPYSPSNEQRPAMPYFADPRTKLLMSLKTNGLLCGEEARKRKAKDAKEYPDVSALASIAKSKERFHDVLTTPGSTASPSMAGSPGSCPSKDPQWLSSNSNEIDEVPVPLSRSISGELDARMDSERADLLWKLVGNGSPELKPLDALEFETDGSQKTGVYLLSSPPLAPRKDPCDLDRIQTIFKPSDEEKFERRGIEVGMGALREEAAFVIDRASGGKANVPVTARLSLEEGGVRLKGSVQKFVEGCVGAIEEFGIPRDLPRAEAMISLDDAQAVACLDMRIFNTDRHPGNLLLAGERPYKLTCIDNGCVLPAWWALDSARFDAWIDLPHVKVAPTAATVSLVSQVNDSLPQVVQELHTLGLPLQAIWTLEICTSLLKSGVLDHGLPLRSIALLMTRDVAGPAEPCWLERKIAQACEAAGGTAEFVPEGKHGDLALRIGSRVSVMFSNASSPSHKRLQQFRDSFFRCLDEMFAHTDVVDAAKAVEESAQFSS